MAHLANVRFVINAIEREQEIAAMVSKHIEFFENNNIRFTRPVQSVDEEYDAEQYETYKIRLETEWTKREQGFTERLLTFFQRPADLQFTVELSNYGPLGFYNEKSNTITVNLNTHLDPVRTIMHEMVHIMLEPFIQKYRIEHNAKESIVNAVVGFLA